MNGWTVRSSQLDTWAIWSTKIFKTRLGSSDRCVMKKLIFAITLFFYSLSTHADTCGQGDINIDFSKMGPNGKTLEGFIRVIDASSLKVKENKDQERADALDLTGLVSRKAICVGDLYCFVARRYEDDKKKTNFRWEPFRKEDPIAKAGSQSRVYVASSFEKATVSSLNTPLLIGRNPTIFAERRENVTMEFRRHTEASDISFSIAVREGKIEIRGPGSAREPQIDLNLSDAVKSKDVKLSSAKSVVFQPYEQLAYEREDREAHDTVTKQRIRATKSKPISKIELNCLREPAQESGRDVLKLSGHTGAAGKH